jgi:hypothetical protein
VKIQVVIRVTLSLPITTGTATGCVTVSRALVEDILLNPAEYYVNVHNKRLSPTARSADS